MDRFEFLNTEIEEQGGCASSNSLPPLHLLGRLWIRWFGSGVWIGEDRRWPGVPRLSQNSERSHELLRKQKIVVKRDFLLSGAYKGREEICQGVVCATPPLRFWNHRFVKLLPWNLSFPREEKRENGIGLERSHLSPSSSSSFFSAPVPLRFSIACLGQINSAVFVSRERKSWRVDIETRYR